jgi:hypothetical protein
MLRWFVLTTLTVAMALGAGADPGWHTGTFRVQGTDIEGCNGMRISAARHEPEEQSSSPLSAMVVFYITYKGGSYKASVSGLPIDTSISLDELFPWLRDVPPQVRFRIRGNTLYFLDSKNRKHKADILAYYAPPASPK